MTQTYVAGAAQATTLTAGITNAVTTFAVVGVTGWPGTVPFAIVVDRGTALEEKMLVTARSGVNLTVTRGYDGTSAVAHSVGTNNVEHCITALQIQEHVDHSNEAASGFKHTSNGIADAAITAPKIQDGAVLTAKIQDGGVTTAKILDAAVTTSKILEANVTAAKLEASLPRGVVGYLQVVANQNSIGAEVDLTGLSLTVLIGTSRRIRITVSGTVGHTDIGEDIIGNIKEGVTVLKQWVRTNVSSNLRLEGAQASVILTPTAGIHSYKATLSATGSSNARLDATSANPAFILVEDIGNA